MSPLIEAVKAVKMMRMVKAVREVREAVATAERADRAVPPLPFPLTTKVAMRAAWSMTSGSASPVVPSKRS